MIKVSELFLKNIHKMIVVGDKILVKPSEANSKTSSGLFLPPGVHEKEKVQSGYVLKSGPGYPIGNQGDDEPWKETKDAVKYIPLQAKEGDLAIFLRTNAFEIEYEGEKLLIVPQSAVLLLIREDLFD